MTDEMSNLDNILYGNMMPWLPDNGNDAKFIPQLLMLKKSSDISPAHFEVKFHRPFDNKSRFYSKFIHSETDKSINRLYQRISADASDHLKAYWLDKILDKKLKTRLRDIGDIIRERNYCLSHLHMKNETPSQDLLQRANAYIIHLLKLSYMRIFLELQETFKVHLTNIFLTEDLYTELLLEPVPKEHFLTRISKEDKSESLKTSKIRKPHSRNGFQSFSYKQYNTAPQKLNDICDSLKKNNFISEDTNVSDFKKLFSGSSIKRQVVWTGNISELFYFIKLIHSKHSLAIIFGIY